MNIFATNRADNKTGFYRIIQPLRFLKRSGWGARTVPFTGKNDVSVLPIHDELLIRLSKDTDFIFTTMIHEEEELLKIMNLRKYNNCRWIVDVSENIYANALLQDYLPIIERSIIAADGIVVSNKILQELYSGLTDKIYVLPSALDFNIWDELKPTVSRKLKIGFSGNKNDLEIISPSLKFFAESHKPEFVNLANTEIIDWPKKLSKMGIQMALFPSEDSNYNRCQNNIDLLECMALKIPVIATPTENHKGLPIMYASNNFEWYEKIAKLISDKKERKNMGIIGYDFVHENYDMKKFVSGFQKWLKELPRKKY